MQGKGVLKDGLTYIGCYVKPAWDHTEIPVDGGVRKYEMPPDKPKYREELPFSFTDEPYPPKYEAFETVAVCESGVIPRDESGGVEIRIKDNTLKGIMRRQGADNIFRVTDVGGGLCASGDDLDGIDVYLGTQWSYQEDPDFRFFWDIAQPIMDLDMVSVEWRDWR